MAARTRARTSSKHESPGLTRDRVCREALALVDEEGLEALSMRRLGARLGVEAMSVYRHVRDKADLLDALHAAVLGDLDAEVSHEGDWRALLGGLAEGLRRTLLRHPKLIPLFATRPVRAAEALVPIVRAWAALERAGFAPDDARKAIIVVGVFTLGHTLGEANGEPAPHLGVPNQPGAAEFDFGLGAMLDGIAARRGSTRGRRSTPEPRAPAAPGGQRGGGARGRARRSTAKS
jgi:TetR/AcrR family transcriptional regulator, tetracycline repressor protein